jgi:hypothetical protein
MHSLSLSAGTVSASDAAMADQLAGVLSGYARACPPMVDQ